MAAPSYNQDLVNITLAEDTTGWSAYGGGASGLSASPDLSMQGTNCVDKQITNADKGQYFDAGAGITLAAGEHIWVWHYCATPGLTDTRQNKGASVLVGSAETAYCQYHVEGNDTYGASGRVARCYPINYSVRSQNLGAEPYRTVTGSPGAAPRVFGGGLNTTASVKGANVGIDAIRRGTGAYLTAGELVAAGDASDNPCTFTGFNTQNDSTTNRWGIFTRVGGGFELQGRFVVGQNSSKTPTLCRFRGSDATIGFVDTIHAAADFSQIIIDHASTRAEFLNVNLTALGTTNRGRFTVNTANPTVIVTGGTWTGLGATTLRSNSTLTGVTIRAADSITANGATVTDCLIDRSFATVTLVHSNLALVTGNTFISDGSNHAVNIGTISTSTTVSWNNQLEGYAAGSTGDPVTTGTSGNEAILCNVASGQKLTINVASGASIPSVKNDGPGTVAVVAGQVTLTVKVVDILTGAPIVGARVIVTAAAGGALPQGTVIIDKVLTDSSGEVSDTRSYSGNQPITGRVRRASSGTLYKTSPVAGTVNSASGLSLTVQMIPDE